MSEVRHSESVLIVVSADEPSGMNDPLAAINAAVDEGLADLEHRVRAYLQTEGFTNVRVST
jgi:hypothetical protein